MIKIIIGMLFCLMAFNASAGPIESKNDCVPYNTLFPEFQVSRFLLITEKDYVLDILWKFEEFFGFPSGYDEEMIDGVMVFDTEETGHIGIIHFLAGNGCSYNRRLVLYPPLSKILEEYGEWEVKE